MTATLFRSSVSSTLNAPTIHQLPSGLTIIAEQMPVEAVSLNLWLNVGSAVEPDSINGMAHFLEHMVFKGTQRLQSGEFERLIEQRGAITNAATSQDYTHYYITTAPQDFADLAPLQIDVAMNPSIPEEAFERERQVVLEEIRRSQDNARRRTFQHVTELSFEQLPYRRQVLGPTAVIEELVPEQMRSFHRHWYRPQATTAVVVGNLAVDRLIQVVEDSFMQAGLGRSDLSLPPPLGFVPEQPFPDVVRRDVIDPTLQQARLILTWRVPGLLDIEQTYALDVLASILGHGRTSRLVQELREERGWVSSISASNTSYLHQGAFYIAAHLPVEHIPQVEAAILQHIRALQTDLLTPEEIAKVRTRVANHYVFGNESPSDRSGIYGYYYALLGDLMPALEYPERIQSLTASQMQAAAQTYLSPDAYGVVVVRPE